MTFTAIDFELANANYNSICAIGIVNVRDGEIINEFYSLVQPPNNEYMWQTTRVHGIKPKHTAESPTFGSLFETIKPLLQDQFMVAHDEQFDRSVLQKTMQLYGLNYKELGLPDIWECTSKIYRSIGFPKTKLSICCSIMGIELKAHDALSDAKACSSLYLKKDIASAFVPKEA